MNGEAPCTNCLHCRFPARGEAQAKPVKGWLSSLNQNRQAVSPPLSTKVTAEIDISKLPLD